LVAQVWDRVRSDLPKELCLKLDASDPESELQVPLIDLVYRDFCRHGVYENLRQTESSPWSFRKACVTCSSPNGKSCMRARAKRWCGRLSSGAIGTTTSSDEWRPHHDCQVISSTRGVVARLVHSCCFAVQLRCVERISTFSLIACAFLLCCCQGGTFASTF